MTAHDAGPATVAYLTAFLHGDQPTARAIANDIAADPESVQVALSMLAGAVFGGMQAAACYDPVAYRHLRELFLTEIGQRAADLANNDT